MLSIRGHVYLHHNNADLFETLTNSVKVAFHKGINNNGNIKAEAPEAGPSIYLPRTTEADAQTAADRKQTFGDIPSCPHCNARMDCRLCYSFASRIIVDDTEYYCNNPICHGGRPREDFRVSPEQNQRTSVQ